MKSRALWIIIALAVLGTIAMAFLQREAEPQATLAPTTPASSPAAAVGATAPRDTDGVGPVATPPPAPTMATATAANVASAMAAAPASTEPKPVVAIQDGRTINFSSGQPMILDTEKDNAALAKALKEMEEATKDITIQPRAVPAEAK